MITPQQLSSSLGRVIQAAIGLIVLAVFGSFIEKLPGVDMRVVEGLRIQEALQLSVAIVMVGVVLGTVRSLANVLNYYTAAIFGLYRIPSRAFLSSDVSKLTDGAAYVVAIAIAWAIVYQQLNVLKNTKWLQNLDWLPTVVTLAFLASILYVLVRSYQALQPILAEVSVGLGRQIVQAVEVRCPNCGQGNTGGVRYCAQCGHDLSGVRTQAGQVADVIVCRQCSATNAGSSRFCGSCGAELSIGTMPSGSADAVTDSARVVSIQRQAQEARRCTQCGGSLDSDDRFCPTCGAVATA